MYTAQWYSDNGIYIQFGEKKPFILNEPLGQPLGAQAQTIKAALQDGATTYFSALEQRTIPIKFTLCAEGNSNLLVKTVLDEHLNLISMAFLPKTMGWLLYQNGRGGNLIRARAVTTPTEIGRTNNIIKFEVELIADSPYWQDSILHEVKIGDLDKQFSFPFTFPFKVGSYTSSSIIHNPQAEEIKPVFEVYSVVDDLTIKNETTGATMTINHNIAENQKMIIDVAESTVFLYEDGVFVSDISNWMDGDFITFIKGDNTIKIVNDAPDDLPACKTIYRVPIWGV